MENLCRRLLLQQNQKIHQVYVFSESEPFSGKSYQGWVNHNVSGHVKRMKNKQYIAKFSSNYFLKRKFFIKRVKLETNKSNSFEIEVVVPLIYKNALQSNCNIKRNFSMLFTWKLRDFQSKRSIIPNLLSRIKSSKEYILNINEAYIQIPQKVNKLIHRSQKLSLCAKTNSFALFNKIIGSIKHIKIAKAAILDLEQSDILVFGRLRSFLSKNSHVKQLKLLLNDNSKELCSASVLEKLKKLDSLHIKIKLPVHTKFQLSHYIPEINTERYFKLISIFYDNAQIFSEKRIEILKKFILALHSNQNVRTFKIKTLKPIDEHDFLEYSHFLVEHIIKSPKQSNQVYKMCVNGSPYFSLVHIKEDEEKEDSLNHAEEIYMKIKNAVPIFKLNYPFIAANMHNFLYQLDPSLKFLWNSQEYLIAELFQKKIQFQSITFGYWYSYGITTFLELVYLQEIFLDLQSAIVKPDIILQICTSDTTRDLRKLYLTLPKSCNFFIHAKRIYTMKSLIEAKITNQKESIVIMTSRTSLEMKYSRNLHYRSIVEDIENLKEFNSIQLQTWGDYRANFNLLMDFSLKYDYNSIVIMHKNGFLRKKETASVVVDSFEYFELLNARYKNYLNKCQRIEIRNTSKFLIKRSSYSELVNYAIICMSYNEIREIIVSNPIIKSKYDSDFKLHEIIVAFINKDWGRSMVLEYNESKEVIQIYESDSCPKAPEECEKLICYCENKSLKCFSRSLFLNSELVPALRDIAKTKNFISIEFNECDVLDSNTTTIDCIIDDKIKRKNDKLILKYLEKSLKVFKIKRLDISRYISPSTAITLKKILSSYEDKNIEEVNIVSQNITSDQYLAFLKDFDFKRKLCLENDKKYWKYDPVQKAIEISCSYSENLIKTLDEVNLKHFDEITIIFDDRVEFDRLKNWLKNYLLFHTKKLEVRFSSKNSIMVTDSIFNIQGPFSIKTLESLFFSNKHSFNYKFKTMSEIIIDNSAYYSNPDQIDMMSLYNLFIELPLIDVIKLSISFSSVDLKDIINMETKFKSKKWNHQLMNLEIYPKILIICPKERSDLKINIQGRLCFKVELGTEVKYTIGNVGRAEENGMKEYYLKNYPSATQIRK